MGKSPTEADLESHFKRLDQKQTGDVDREEAMAYLKGIVLVTPKSNIDKSPLQNKFDLEEVSKTSPILLKTATM